MAFKYVERKSSKAKKRPGKSYIPKGKKPKLGSGKRFKALEVSIAKRGKVSNPRAVAASIMYKKYGAKKGHSMGAAGRHRAAVKRHAK
jgi:hypothetical protein